MVTLVVDQRHLDTQHAPNWAKHDDGITDLHKTWMCLLPEMCMHHGQVSLRHSGWSARSAKIVGSTLNVCGQNNTLREVTANIVKDAKQSRCPQTVVRTTQSWYKEIKGSKIKTRQSQSDCQPLSFCTTSKVSSRICDKGSPHFWNTLLLNAFLTLCLS